MNLFRERRRARTLFVPVLFVLMLVLAACNGEEAVDAPEEDEVVDDDVDEPDDEDDADDEAAEPEELPEVPVLAFNTGLGQLFMSAMETEGFDEANGFQGDFIYVEPAAATETFLQREAEVSIQMDPLVASIARNQGEEVSVVAPSLTNNASIIAGADSGIESPEDLVGATVGHFGMDSGTTSIMRVLLDRDWGIDLVEDVNLVEAGPPALVELLAAGEVDAILDFTPHSERALVDAGGEVILRADDPDHGFIPGVAAVAVHEAWAQENPDLAQSVLDAVADACAFFVDSDYEVFRDQPYRDLLATQSDEELEQVISRAQEHGLMSCDWDEQIVEEGREFLQQVADQGILFDEYPGDRTMLTLDEILD